MSTDLSTQTDAMLVAACRAGQPAAWRALVARYQRLIYTVARRAGLNEHDGADVLQACFQALLQQLNQLQQPDRLQAWLVTLARREALHLLAERRRKTGGLPTGGARGSTDGSDAEDPLTQIPSPDPLPAEQLQALQDQDRVRRALATLDTRSRALLTGLYLRDPAATYDELAIELDMAPGSIGPTRQRCLDKLRRALEALP